MLLHGHQLERNLARAVTAEAAGTFVLVLAITSTAVAATLSRPIAGTPYGSLAVPVAGGAALAIAVAGAGHISGAHLNPAVTLGLAVPDRDRAGVQRALSPPSSGSGRQGGCRGRQPLPALVMRGRPVRVRDRQGP